jgi:DUF971 family protein
MNTDFVCGTCDTHHRPFGGDDTLERLFKQVYDGKGDDKGKGKGNGDDASATTAAVDANENVATDTSQSTSTSASSSTSTSPTSSTAYVRLPLLAAVAAGSDAGRPVALPPLPLNEATTSTSTATTAVTSEVEAATAAAAAAVAAADRARARAAYLDLAHTVARTLDANDDAATSVTFRRGNGDVDGGDGSGGVLVVDDGVVSFKVSAWLVRRRCQCAACVDEHTNRPRIGDTDVAVDVAAEAIHPRGRAAVHIRWSDGHDSGIYPIAMLRKLADEQVATAAAAAAK